MDKPTSLLEQAKLIHTNLNHVRFMYTKEHAELAVGWINGDITVAQIRSVVKKRNNNSVYIFLALALRKAYDMKMLQKP